MNSNGLRKAIYDQSAVVVDDVQKALFEARRRDLIVIDDEKLTTLVSLLKQTIEASFMKMGPSIDRVIKQTIG